MEGRNSNFEPVLADFLHRLETAMYVAVDMELTGISIEKEPDDYLETARERLSKLCRIAELHAPMQIGLTLVTESQSGKAILASYNFLAFPKQGSFVCSATAMRFNSDNNKVDLNAWVREGVPYITRNEEQKERERIGSDLEDLESGLLRLWKALTAKKLPLIVHSPQDLFFLLTAFEQKPLPREDPQALANLVFQCFPCVYDTAFLHGSIGGFREMKLTSFLREARERYEQLRENGKCEIVEFELEAETAARYNDENGSDFHAHEAGYDSLATAQLFALLFKISPDRVTKSQNSLFLYKNAEYISLMQARDSGNPGCNVFDLTCVTPLIVRFDKVEFAKDVQRSIVNAGFEYKKVNDHHLIVIITSVGDNAIEEATKLSPKVGGVTKWMPLASYLQEIRQSRPAMDNNRQRLRNTRIPHPRESASVDAARAAMSGIAAAATPYQAGNSCSSRDDGRSTSGRGSEGTRYFGVIKALKIPERYGFITCEAIHRFSGRDVFVHLTQLSHLAGYEVGSRVSFTMKLNDKQQAQAFEVELLDDHANSSSRREEADFVAEDPAAAPAQRPMLFPAEALVGPQHHQQQQQALAGAQQAFKLCPAQVPLGGNFAGPCAGGCWVSPQQAQQMQTAGYMMIVPTNVNVIPNVKAAPLVPIAAQQPQQRQATLGELGAAPPPQRQGEQQQQRSLPPSQGAPSPSNGGGSSSKKSKSSREKNGGASAKGKHRSGQHDTDSRQTDRTLESTRCTSSDDGGSVASNNHNIYNFQ